MTLPSLMSQQQAWLLIPKTTLENIEPLYNDGQAPKPHWLFATTILDHLKEQGPLVVNITNTKLYESYRQKTDDWQGYIIYTHASDKELLKQLRAILTIRFYGEEKGILNYFHPQVATYFFKMPQEQLIKWLGPIDLITWVGGTYLELDNNQQTQYCIKNPQPQQQNSALTEEPKLTSEQEQLLSEHQAQYELWEWCRARNISYTQAWNCQQEGLQLSFKGPNLLDYITLRLKNLRKTIPPNFPTTATAENKLTILKTHWNS